MSHSIGISTSTVKAQLVTGYVQQAVNVVMVIRFYFIIVSFVLSSFIFVIIIGIVVLCYFCFMLLILFYVILPSDYLEACLACPIAMHVEGLDVVQAGTKVRGLRQDECHNQQR